MHDNYYNPWKSSSFSGTIGGERQAGYASGQVFFHEIDEFICLPGALTLNNNKNGIFFSYQCH